MHFTCRLVLARLALSEQDLTAKIRSQTAEIKRYLLLTFTKRLPVIHTSIYSRKFASAARDSWHADEPELRQLSGAQPGQFRTRPSSTNDSQQAVFAC